MTDGEVLEKYKSHIAHSLGGLQAFEMHITRSYNTVYEHSMIWFNSLIDLFPNDLRRLHFSLRRPDGFGDWMHGRANKYVRPGEELPSMFRPEKRYGLGSRPAITIYLGQLSKLYDLNLGGLTCTSKELRAILDGCKFSVRHLALRDIELVPEQHQDPDQSLYQQPRACLVSMFRWIERKFNLLSFNCRGSWSNMGMQHGHATMAAQCTR